MIIYAIYWGLILSQTRRFMYLLYIIIPEYHKVSFSPPVLKERKLILRNGKKKIAQGHRAYRWHSLDPHKDGLQRLSLKELRSYIEAVG